MINNTLKSDAVYMYKHKCDSTRYNRGINHKKKYYNRLLAGHKYDSSHLSFLKAYKIGHIFPNITFTHLGCNTKIKCWDSIPFLPWING